MLNNEKIYSVDLPSNPCINIGTILVTGASGYIGGRLAQELFCRGYHIRIMVRTDSPEQSERWPYAEIVVADALKPETLDAALKGVSIAYYLIHSLPLGSMHFEDADTRAAINFREAADRNNVKRIIYLGGLGDTRHKLSKHLKSRINVALELCKGNTPVTILRAAVIIGSGSASYEIIKNLVKNSVLLPIPKWARTKCQPISIRDVIKYLIGVLEIEETAGQSFDIGGRSLHSYKDMLKICATLLRKKRLFINSIIPGYKGYVYAASLITPVPFHIVLALMEGGANEVICQNNSIKKYLNFDTLSYTEAIVYAMDREEQDKIHTRWSDAYPPSHELAIKLHEIDKPEFISSFSLETSKSAANLFNSICKIGGKEGWFHNNWMWRTRGFIDRIFMGIGTSRGRRSINSLRTNDVIGFWRIENFDKNKKLLLRAEMKLPGKAWLEFNIQELPNNINKISAIAYFQPVGFFGRPYWYTFLPFHNIIFSDLLKQIEKRS